MGGEAKEQSKTVRVINAMEDLCYHMLIFTEWSENNFIAAIEK